MSLAVHVLIRVTEQPLIDRVTNKVDLGEEPRDESVCELLGRKVLDDLGNAIGMDTAFIEKSLLSVLTLDRHTRRFSSGVPCESSVSSTRCVGG